MKIKKLMAILMATTMIMGSTVSTFAAQGDVPTDQDKCEVSVSNVDTGASVIAYQIVDGVYNTNGFVKYEAVDGVIIANPLRPADSEIQMIADQINEGNLSLTSKTLTDADNDGEYVGELNPGYWLVLVRSSNGAAKIYNPMLVSVAYSVGGSDNTMTGGSVDASMDWNLNGKNAWAKSSDVSITKDAKNTADFGEVVDYTIKTTIPQYGPEYKDVTFKVNDKLADGDLKLTNGTVSIKVSGTDVEATNYEITGNVPDSTEFTVEFKSDYVLANKGKEIVITYQATVTKEKVNEKSHDNTVTLTYSNNPATTDTKTDTEKVYSFDIDGDLTGNILKKVAPGEKEGSTIALENAEFTLYTDKDCKTQYTNEVHVAGAPTATTTDQGKIYIKGLDVGTYYLKETKAPDGYTLNDTVYKIVVDATVTDEELKNWSIIVTDMTTGTGITNEFNVNNNAVTPDEDNGTTNIMNTKIASLPSTGGIGTTIFTIGGCVIMIAAAGLFFASRRKSAK